MLEKIDQATLRKFLGYNPLLQDVSGAKGSPQYVEPCEGSQESQARNSASEAELNSSEKADRDGCHNSLSTTSAESGSDKTERIIQGRVLRMGDYIDTDAVSLASIEAIKLC